MHFDHIDKKLRDELAQQFLHHRIHLKHQMTSKRLKTNNLVVKFTASLFKDGRPFCDTSSCSRKTASASSRCEASCRVDSSCSRQDVVVSRFFDAVSQDLDVAITSTANDDET